jgi:tetratricopeptide (TPR) repeat protein
VPTFKLQFPAERIPELAERFAYRSDERCRAAGAAARMRGHYIREEFMVVCAWKTPRSGSKVSANSTAAIAAATGRALASSSEAVRMEALLGLVGVGVPTASTLLHFAFPDHYPILDVRALESLGVKGRTVYSVSFWLAYLSACRELTAAHRVHIRTLDKALWQYSKERSAGREFASGARIDLDALGTAASVQNAARSLVGRGRKQAPQVRSVREAPVAANPAMNPAPTPEQHRALLSDCWELARAYPTSGVLNRGGRPYRAIRFERKLDAVANDPEGLLEYVRGLAYRTTHGLDALVEHNRLDLTVETLIVDKSKVYAPLFTAGDRAAAAAKLARRAGQVEELARDRTRQAGDPEQARSKHVDELRRSLPKDQPALRELAGQQLDPETAIAINESILQQAPRDVVALNRLGRAYEAIGSIDQARSAFRTVLTIDPTNKIAARRLRQLEREG